MRRIHTITLVALLLSALAPNPTRAQDQRCFPETGQCISGNIRAFWQNNGGLAVFGYPITALTTETNADGFTGPTQWFERDRLEDHGGGMVLAGRLGAQKLVMQGRPWETLPKGAPGRGDCIFFNETGHTLCPPFRAYWESNGGLARFGYPISEQVGESNDSGFVGTVQWFERRRMEFHEANQPPYNVLLGLLGKEVRGGSTVAPAPVPPPPAPAPPISDQCAGIPPTVSAAVRPSNCVPVGTVVYTDIFGFAPNEQVRISATAPGEAPEVNNETISIGPLGAVYNIPLETVGFPLGLWNLTITGQSSGHQAIIWFKLIPVGQAPPPAPVPPPAPPSPPPGLPPSFNGCQVDPYAGQAPNAPVRIAAIDKGNETVTLRNVSQAAVNLDGWRMCSVTGNQEHFGIGGTLAPGQSRIFTNTGTGPIWLNSASDPGALYNPQGQLVSYWPD